MIEVNEFFANEFFVVGGTLRADSPSYVTRAADDELFSSLVAGEFCYVLTPRQMGKSSLMVRTAQRLRAQDIRVVRIDLTSIGTVTSDEWYLGLLSRIRSELRLTVDVQAWWQAQPLSAPQNFLAFLRTMVLAEQPKPIVIFIDEIDSTLNLDFRDDFFAAIRAVYNGRANEMRYNRLTFAFLGVATPTELIRDRKRAPFNIGRRIDLHEFGYQEARPLLVCLEALFPTNATAILHRIFHWTNGHPYLTQKLCLAIAGQATTPWDDQTVDALVAQTLLSADGRKDTNLLFIQDRILSHPLPERRAMLRLYQQIYNGESIADDERSPIQNRLELYGLIGVRENKLHVRNAIYRTVFNTDWLKALTRTETQPRPSLSSRDWRNVFALIRARRWLALGATGIGLLALLVAILFLRVAFGEPSAPSPTLSAATAMSLRTATQHPPQSPTEQRPQIEYDQELQTIIEDAQLSAYPGQSLRTVITDPLPALGQLLFFDPILSGDENIACADCHHPRHAMADGRVLPIGAGGYGLGPDRQLTPAIAANVAMTVGLTMTVAPVNANGAADGVADGLTPNLGSGQWLPRNSPSLINSALYRVHMWDGRMEGAYDTAVEDQSDAELLHNNPLIAPLISKELMAGITLGDQEPAAIVATLLARLQANTDYVTRFQNALGRADLPPNALITLPRVTQALFAFEKALIFVNAPWDRYIEGNLDALTEQQKRGALLFFGNPETGDTCSECHRGNQFSDFKAHPLLVPQVGPGKGHGANGHEDWGYGGIAIDTTTGATTDAATNVRDRCAFRTPSLRNVALTAPYFHDGAFATLADAIRHHQDAEQSAAQYDPRANQIPPALLVQPLSEDCRQAWRTRNRPPMTQLTDADIEDLVQFLHSLTDPATTALAYLNPPALPNLLPLASQPAIGPAVIPTLVPIELPLVQQPSSPLLELLQRLLAPEDEHGKGALFGAAEQQEVALQHLGFLQETLAANDLAEARRHTEHVINILVGEGDKKYDDHNLDDTTECPGDKVGVGNYLRQVQEQTESLLADLDNRPESNELRLQIEQIAALSQAASALITSTVDLALPLFDVGNAAKAKPLAQELKVQLDTLTTAIDQVVAKVQPLLGSTMPLTDSKSARLGGHFAVPQDGARVMTPFTVVMAAGGLIVEPAGAIHGDAGHFHILIDTDFVDAGVLIPFDHAHLHFGDGQITTTLPLKPGVHTVRLQFANGEHIALDGEEYRDSITVTVTTNDADTIHVPASEFTMGTEAGYPINVNEFWIMRTEVTYRQYAACIEAKACTEPDDDPNRWRDPMYAAHPVTNIDWQQANAYAAWVGGRLPTEAEWEKACRGQDARLYPWGNGDPTDQLANYNGIDGDTKPVGYYPDGASPYGVLDMSGNAWEWTSSLEAGSPYQPDDGREDLQAAGKRIIRGGSFYYGKTPLACTHASPVAPDSYNNQTGLRVVFDQPAP